MAGSSAPNSDAELVERVRKLQPLIRAHALRTEQERRVTGEVFAALTDAGVHRMTVPRRYGGYQSSAGTQVDVLSEISAGCGSTGFTTLIQAGCAFIAALFPDEPRQQHTHARGEREGNDGYGCEDRLHDSFTAA